MIDEGRIGLGMKVYCPMSSFNNFYRAVLFSQFVLGTGIFLGFIVESPNLVLFPDMKQDNH